MDGKVRVVPGNGPLTAGRVVVGDLIRESHIFSQRKKGVPEAYRNVEHLPAFRSELDGHVAAESRRTAAQVDRDIEQCSLSCPNEFPLRLQHLIMNATHDVFLKAFRRLDQFRGEASVRTWLYRIAINHCQNLCQSWQNRNIHSNADDAVWENSAAPTDSPLRVLETKELGQRIQQTLDALSEEYRLLLLLVADEELSYEEIAVLVGQSADAVRGKLHRARKVFAAHFEKTA